MKIIVPVLMLSALLLFNSCDDQKKTVNLATTKDSLSYAIGVMIGSDLKKQSMDTLTDINIFLQAMRDMLTIDGAPQLTTEESDKIVQSYLALMNDQKYLKNKTDGENFLTENGKRKEVTTLSSGLQYEVVKEGTGPKATVQNKVQAHYTGTLTDGTVFEDSRKNEKPAEFELGAVIKGWQEGICLMNKGAHYKIYIPWYLAYGEQGIPGAIPPYTTLIFDVELISIVK